MRPSPLSSRRLCARFRAPQGALHRSRIPLHRHQHPCHTRSDSRSVGFQKTFQHLPSTTTLRKARLLAQVIWHALHRTRAKRCYKSGLKNGGSEGVALQDLSTRRRCQCRK